MNREQIAVIIMFILFVASFGILIHMGLEYQKLADECRSEYGGTFDSGYCTYIRDGNSYSRYMTKDSLGGKGE